MGFWDWLTSLFGGWSGDSRYAEEKTEARIEKNERKITRAEMRMEKDERKKLELVMAELEELSNDIRKGKIPDTQIRSGNQMIMLSQCMSVLIQYMQGLIRNKIPISQEIQMFGNIKLYWSAARNGMGGIVYQMTFSRDKKKVKIAQKVNKFIIYI